jgi:hypothetical protein
LSTEEGVTVRENRDRCDHEDFRFGIFVEIRSRNHLDDRVGDISGERPWGQHSPVSIGSYTPRHPRVHTEEA